MLPVSMAVWMSSRSAGIAALHGGDQWQRGFAFAQVVAQVLAHDGGVAGVVQHVVDHLKGGAQGLSVVGAGGF